MWADRRVIQRARRGLYPCIPFERVAIISRKQSSRVTIVVMMSCQWKRRRCQRTEKVEERRYSRVVNEVFRVPLSYGACSLDLGTFALDDRELSRFHCATALLMHVRERRSILESLDPW